MPKMQLNTLTAEQKRNAMPKYKRPKTAAGEGSDPHYNCFRHLIRFAIIVRCFTIGSGTSAITGNMSIESTINQYLEGWRLGDGQLSLAATAESFYYDDPNTGRIQRENFVQFVEDFKTAAAEMGDGTIPTPFLVYRDIVIQDHKLPATVWCWWQVQGIALQGSALIKVAEPGVLSECIAYFSRLPD